MYKKRGFTWIELLVVVGVLAALIFVAIPAISKARFNAKVKQAMRAGSRICGQLFVSSGADDPLFLPANDARITWPRSTDKRPWASSSHFFDALIRSNCLQGISYDLFAAGDIKPAKTSAEFLDGKLHNAWCVVRDVNSKVTGNTVVFFTQNMKFTNPGPQAMLDQMMGPGEVGAEPFGDKVFAFVLRGGESVKIDRDTPLIVNGMSLFMRYSVGVESNTVLWPLSAGQSSPPLTKKE